MTDTPGTKVKIAVVGAGLIGLMATTELANRADLSDTRIALVGPRGEGTDGRTTAMLMPTVERLRQAGVWESVQEKTAPLRTMRLADGSKRLLRAPLVDFDAGEIEQDAFGYNVPNADLIELLEQHLSAKTNVSRIESPVESCTANGTGIALHLSSEQRISSAVVVAADGRGSMLRECAGIETRSWSYPQVALVTNFTHTLPHNGVSTEFHTETGPFTQVPLPAKKGAKQRSSLVWVVNPKEVDGILALDLNTVSRRIESRMQSMLGAVTVEKPLQSFPLSGMTARRFAANRIALVGEASHVFPPIGAQGFNLGVRDVVAFAETIDLADIDGSLAAYDQSRRADVATRTAGVDLLNRSLLTGFLPVQMARAAGLGILSAFTPLRKLAMRQGMGVGMGTR